MREDSFFSSFSVPVQHAHNDRALYISAKTIL